ncbi:MAG: FMN-binding negative transcriptional regulator [Maritimibacter sp.]
MHQHPKYHEASPETINAFLRHRSFGTLFLTGPDGPLAMQAPFVMNDDNTAVEMHIFRGNPIAQALTSPQPALLSVIGPDGYISPDWYGPGDFVSTWNYVAVQLKGRLELRPSDELRAVLETQTEIYEARLPKAPWSMDKLPAKKRDAMMRVIHPMRLVIETVEPTFKLGQEKAEAARLGAANALETGFGQELADLAAMMRAGGPEISD